MSSKRQQPSLQVGVCSHEAAEYACRNWHYSACLPSGKLSRFGVWEDGRFIGCVLFGRGATPAIGKPFGLTQLEVCELVRIALAEHAAPVSRIVAIILRLLHRCSPGLKLVISYADPGMQHHGGIYQAGNWLYLGTSQPQTRKMAYGKPYHKRSVSSVIGATNKLPDGPIEVKHKYAYPFDPQLRARLLPQTKPYPKSHAPLL